MTTKVTVDAHAGWPVEVTLTDVWTVDGEESPQVKSTVQVVAPHTTQDFYITSSRSLQVKELPNAA